MKKNFLGILGLSTLLSACSLFSGLNEADFYTRVVETINVSSQAIETSITLYGEDIPDMVTEDSMIDASTMQASLAVIQNALKDSVKLIELQSQNVEQMNAVHTELTTYLKAADEYTTTYSSMVDYYANGTYQTDIEKVKVHNTALHTAYSTFIEANNDLVETLESFVK